MARPKTQRASETTRRIRLMPETVDTLRLLGDIHQLSQRELFTKTLEFIASLRSPAAEQYVLGNLHAAYLEQGREALLAALSKRDKR